MPAFLSSLLQRTRTGLLAVLLVVLPLQGVVPLIAGLQGHRHFHTGASSLARLTLPLRVLLDRLHAAQDARLQARLPFGGFVSQGPAAGRHAHGGVLHEHGADTADAVHVGDAVDEPQQSGATPFLAWLPAALPLPAGEPGPPPAGTRVRWRDRVVAPPRVPPRG